MTKSLLKRLLISGVVAGITGSLALYQSSALAHSLPLALSLLLAPGMIATIAVETLLRVKNETLFYVTLFVGQFLFWYVVVSIIADIRQSRMEKGAGTSGLSKQ